MKTEADTNISTRLRAIRIWRQVSTADLAEKTGIAVKRLSRIESGNSSASASEIVRCAQALGVIVSNITGEVPLQTGDDNG